MRYEFDGDGRLRLHKQSKNGEVHLRLDADGKLKLQDVKGVEMLLIERDVDFAILYERKYPEDDIAWKIICHGAKQPVVAHHRKIWFTCNKAANDIIAAQTAGRLSMTPAADRDKAAQLRDQATRLELLTLPVRTLTQEALGEINECLNTTGRIEYLRGRMESLGIMAAPEEVPVAAAMNVVSLRDRRPD